MHIYNISCNMKYIYMYIYIYIYIYIYNCVILRGQNTFISTTQVHFQQPSCGLPI